MLNIIDPKPGTYVVRQVATKPARSIPGDISSWQKPNIAVIDPQGAEIHDLTSIAFVSGGGGRPGMVHIDFERKLIHEERAQQFRISVDVESVKFVSGQTDE